MGPARPLLPLVRRDVRPRKYEQREIINGILYVLRAVARGL
jgi:hypothetical protein